MSDPATDHIRRHKGFVGFCETNLRYEKGLKAWASLGPYLLGLAAFEVWIQLHSSEGSRDLWPWIAFLVYLVLFPTLGRKLLKLMRAKKARIS